jgi:[CysO sulfur-carrier protein]-S-L-cysteine hydrolase
MSELRITRDTYAEMVAHCLDAYPLEGCGLLAIRSESTTAELCLPTKNAAGSARVYTVDPLDHLHADRRAEQLGLEIGAVFHSHTHTAAFPSPTDVAQAPMPEWHYVLVSLAAPKAEVRSFRIIDGNIDEEPVVVTG